jgi:hypothetical protein
MPSPFDITALTSTVTLDHQRRGKASYTIRNISGQPIRGRAQLAVVGQTPADWLTLAGETERDFPTGGTQQFTVDITVPLDAAVGSYAFRLDMVGVENPDELYSQGQQVTFQVPEVPPPPPPPVNKGYLRTVVGAIIGILAGLAIGAILGLIIAFVVLTLNPGMDLGGALAAIILPLIIFGALGYWLGTVFGAWVGLNTGKYDWARQTALVLAGVAPVWTIAILALASAVGGGISNQIVGSILGLITLLLVLVVPGLVARAIILRWKTGNF